MSEPRTPRHHDRPVAETPRHAMGHRVVCATPRRGKAISNYSLGDRIGRGAFATVYKAIQLRTAEVVAIKQIPLDKIKSVDSIMSEIDLLQDLEHPNIVKYFGFMKDEMHLNIVLEYCENGSLATILHRFGSFPENLVAQYMRQVLEGLAYLHQEGTIHRDIKGANILTTKNGVAKLADFGVAMRMDNARVGERPGVVGTPHWMAPEIIQMQEASPACDIWSLGATVVELRTGKPPYGEREDIPAMYAIVQQDSLQIVPADSSASLRDFLMLCFEKDPALRVQAKDLLRHLWIRKFGRDNEEVLETEQAVKEWNDPGRRKRLAVPSMMYLRADLKRSAQDDSDYELDFASLGMFGPTMGPPKLQRTEPPNQPIKLFGSVIADVTEDNFGDRKCSPLEHLAIPARKPLSAFVDSSSEYDADYEINDLGIKEAPARMAESADPFLGLDDLMADDIDETMLCAQEEATELVKLISNNECDVSTAFKRLRELVISKPPLRQTLDSLRVLPKSLSVLSRLPLLRSREVLAFLSLVEACIPGYNASDFITNFCIAGGLSFVLAQARLVPSNVLRLLTKMTRLTSKEDDDKMSIARQLAFREDAVAVICAFFEPTSSASDVLHASTVILEMFRVCGPRHRANLWHHFNAYGLFTKLVDMLHLPMVLENGAENMLAGNMYKLIVSFSRTPQELLTTTVDHSVLRRLMRAYLKLPETCAHRRILLEFFKNVSTLVPILDAMQRGNVAPHLIRALSEAMEHISELPKEARTTANCLVPTLFNYARIERYRQREVARYGLLSVLQQCIKEYPGLREFAFSIFAALVHAGHDECWRALWDAHVLEVFIALITESGWQAMAIAAVTAWLDAQLALVRQKFVPKINSINIALLNSSGTTFESILSAVASLLDRNRYLCRDLNWAELFVALNNYLSSPLGASSAPLVQALQVVSWIVPENPIKAAATLAETGLLESIQQLEFDKEVPVLCKKLIRHISAAIEQS